MRASRAAAAGCDQKDRQPNDRGSFVVRCAARGGVWLPRAEWSRQSDNDSYDCRFDVD